MLLYVLRTHVKELKNVYICGHIGFRDSSISYTGTGVFHSKENGKTSVRVEKSERGGLGSLVPN